MPSSVITSIRFLPDQMQLIVHFVSGDVYAYEDVPEKVFKFFKASLSKGRFLNSVIKPKYKSKKLN